MLWLFLILFAVIVWLYLSEDFKAISVNEVPVPEGTIATFDPDDLVVIDGRPFEHCKKGIVGHNVEIPVPDGNIVKVYYGTSFAVPLVWSNPSDEQLKRLNQTSGTRGLEFTDYIVIGTHGSKFV